MEKTLMKILNRAIRVFLEGNDSSRYEDVLREGLETVSSALSVNRVSFWRNFTKDDETWIEELYTWDAGGAVPAECETAPCPLTKAAPHWEQAMNRGEAVNLTIAELSAEELSLFPGCGAKAVLITPLFRNDRLSGLVLFQSNNNDCRFDPKVADVLNSVGLLCYNTILIYNERLTNRDKASNMETELQLRLKHQELLTDISRAFVSGGDTPGLLVGALEKLGRLIGALRLGIISIDYERLSNKFEYFWLGEDAPPFPSGEFDITSLITQKFSKNITDENGTRFYNCHEPEECHREAMKGIFVGSFCWSPLYVSGSLWGVLSVESPSPAAVWGGREAELINTMSHILSGAISRDIADRERIAALKQAVKASKAKGEFLSNMSHEMRTPMNAIIGMTHVGKNAQDIERKDYALGKIGEASTHLLGVINDVLDMSKIEANKLELVFNEYSFEKMLKKVVNAMGLRIEDKNQQFYINVDGRIPHYLIGDDQRLAQVIINLLSNATKFTPEGGTININAELVSEIGNFCTVKIEVCDTGIGMNEEQISRLFTAFEQADSSTARKFGGTGLGLVISRRIVELMDGEITVRSVIGGGSTFSFTFSAARGAENNEQWLDPSVNWKNIQVLIVDDSPEICEYLSAVFDRLGVFCDTASNGREALKMVDKHGAYNIYFVDWRMPEMDGIEFTRIIKSRDKAEDRKSVVIMISSTEWSQIKDEAAEAGVDKYLLKPLFASNIVDCLNVCLGTPRVEEAARLELGPGEWRGYRFMLAEDVAINREIFQSIMEGSGAEIVCAANGVEALSMFIEAPNEFDIIFMDVQMPEMDGLEATRRIRAVPHPYAREVPIVAMTANVFKDDIESCLQAGMNDHIGKPLNMDEVFKKLKHYGRRKYD